jgi:hypothetical protein
LFTKDIDLERKVFELLPLDGSPMRWKDIYEKGIAMGISKITIERKIEDFTKKGILIRNEKGHKDVTYSISKHVATALLLKETILDFNNLVNIIKQDQDKSQDLVRLITEVNASLKQISDIVNIPIKENIHLDDSYSVQKLDER